MYLSGQRLLSYQVLAPDDAAGEVRTIYLDTRTCVVRYFAVHVLSAPFDVRLVSPVSIRDVNSELRTLGLDEPLGENPTLQSGELPSTFNRADESRVFAYHDWQPYWVGCGLWGESDNPRTLARGPYIDAGPANNRSEHRVVRFDLALDSFACGPVSTGLGAVDVLIDPRSWRIEAVL